MKALESAEASSQSALDANLQPKDLQPINAVLATAAVPDVGRVTQPSAATASPVPVPPSR